MHSLTVDTSHISLLPHSLGMGLLVHLSTYSYSDGKSLQQQRLCYHHHRDKLDCVHTSSLHPVPVALQVFIDPVALLQPPDVSTVTHTNEHTVEDK